MFATPSWWRRATVVVAAAFVSAFATSSLRSQEFVDDFESDTFDVGPVIEQSAGAAGVPWEGWNLDANADAEISDEFAAGDSEQSIKLLPTSDVVKVLRGNTGGVWKFSTKVYIPSGHTGQTFIILLNTYNHSGAQNWSTQVIFENGTLRSAGGSGFGGGGQTGIVFDEWIDFEVEIDFDLNVQVISYNGAFLDETPWTVSGQLAFECVDLYSAGGSDAFFDDVAVEKLDIGVRPTRAVALEGDCPDTDVAVTVSQPVPDGANAAEVVTVVEQIDGVLPDNITAANGGSIEGVLPAGLTASGWIGTWYAAGPIENPGGAAPGDDAIRADSLTDGADIFEEDYEPVSGDRFSPVAGLRQNNFNAGADPGELIVQTVQSDGGGIVDWNVIWTDINNVMVYMWAYVQVEEDVEVHLCLGSDDAVQVLIDGEEVHINNVARGWGGGCQDLVTLNLTTQEPILLEGGETYLFTMKVFEGGGGHRGGLQIQDALTGLPAEGVSIVAGRDEGAEFEPVGSEITWDVARSQVASGVGYTVSEVAGSISFSGSVDGNRTIGDRSVNVCLPKTDPNGTFLASSFLAYGPFGALNGGQIACGAGPEILQGNYIAPENILCFAPAAGEEFEHDTEAGADTYYGPTGPNGMPMVREYGGVLPNLDSEFGGDDRMQWMITYVEYVGDAPIDVEFCMETDDGALLVLDDLFIHVNNVCRGTPGLCGGDLISATIEPGVHRLAGAAFDRGGGWGFRLSIRQVGGAPIVDGAEDWIFHGVNRPEGYELECPECNPEAVRNLTCEFGSVGFGGRGVLLSWENPASTDPFTPTRILVNGAQVATVDSDATEAAIPQNALPSDAPFSITVVHCGGIGAECSPFFTTATGQINGGAFLALGPWSTPVACDGNPDALLENAIGPVESIACQFPANGDAIDGYVPGDPLFPDPATSSTRGYHPNAPTGDGEGNDGELPIWRPFQDSTLGDGDLDFDQDVVGGLDEHVTYLATWIENISDQTIPIQACFGSDDDGQVWLDSVPVHNNAACRGRGDCQDTIIFDLPPGAHVLKLAAWEQGGGWGARIQLNSGNDQLPIGDVGVFDEEPVLDATALGWSADSEVIVFHGPNRPGSEDDYECIPPQAPVENLTCNVNGDRVEVEWIVPEGNDIDTDIVVSVNGTEVARLGGDEEVFEVDLGDVDTSSGIAEICVQAEGARKVCCGVFVGEELYLNAGGPQFTDADGRVWLGDTQANPSPFLTSANQNVAGNGLVPDLTFDEFSTENNIPADIFNNERWNDGPVEYTITGLSDGDTYDVTLFFMEHCCSDGCLDQEVEPDPCDAIDLDGLPPPLDATVVSSSCRVFDVAINDEVVLDQFSKNAAAACAAGVAPGAPAYGIGISVTFEGVSPVDGAIKVLIDDLGAGNPPENASIKGFCLQLSGAAPVERNCDDGVDNDGDGDADCDDSDCAGQKVCEGGEGFGFLRADTDGNGQILLNDAIQIFGFLFQGGRAPPCLAAADASKQGQVNLTSGIYILNFLFTGGAAPAAPYPTCGKSDDAGDTAIGCEEEHCP